MQSCHRSHFRNANGEHWLWVPFSYPLQRWAVWYGMTHFQMQKKKTWNKIGEKYMSFAETNLNEIRVSQSLCFIWILSIVNHFITTDFIYLRSWRIICIQAHTCTHTHTLPITDYYDELPQSNSAPNNNNHWWILPNNSVKCSWFSMILHNHMVKCTLYVYCSVLCYVSSCFTFNASNEFVWRFSILFCGAFCEFMSHIFINVSVVPPFAFTHFTIVRMFGFFFWNWERVHGMQRNAPMFKHWISCGNVVLQLTGWCFSCLFWTSVLCLIIIICSICVYTLSLFGICL